MITGNPAFDTIQVIEDYARLDHHRTGTPEDKATCSWLQQQFRAQGLTTTAIGFPFTQYVAEWRCTVNALNVDAIPLYYCSRGHTNFDQIEIQRLDLNDWQEGETLTRIAALAEKQKQAGLPALVLATHSDNGSVYALNVSPEMELDFPVLLTGSEQAGSTASGYLRAELVESESHCLVAENHPKPELILTTPFSGWFHCAAERGAGITVLLALIQRLQSVYRIQVIATSGHELHHLGTDAIQDSLSIDPSTPVLHIGSCVGVADSELVLSSNIPLDHNLASMDAWSELNARYQQLEASPANVWPGESRNWASAERSLISLVGVDKNFHTPRDTPDKVDLSPLSNTVRLLESLVTEALMPDR